MKPSPQSHRGFIYENQTPSAITDQEQQPSGRGYQGRTGKAINCQSLHRSTSPVHHYQPLTSPPPLPLPSRPHHPPGSAHRHTSRVQQLLLYAVHARTHARTLARELRLCINHYVFVHLDHMTTLAGFRLLAVPSESEDCGEGHSKCECCIVIYACMYVCVYICLYLFV